MSCVPYSRKGWYFALTVPFWLVLLAVVVYLGTVSLILAVVLILLYLATSFFQAYCCAYQDCPYVGGFCPAVIGIMPASLMAKALYGDRPLEKSKQRFDRSVTWALVAWVGVAAFPLYWLAQLGMAFAIGYLACHVVYTAVFGLTVCPACAIRDICPGGAFQRMVFRNKN